MADSSSGDGVLQRYRLNHQLHDAADAGDVVKLRQAIAAGADPSAPDAFVEGIMEGREWVWNDGLWKESDIAAVKESIDNSSMNDLTEKKLKAFENLLRNFQV